jgi:hypothetical protein
MGREIVYCEVCGAQILPQEFEKGRAVSVGTRNWCFKCRKQAPAAAVAGAVARAGAGTTTAAKAATPLPQRVKPGATARPAGAPVLEPPAAAPGRGSTRLLALIAVGEAVLLLAFGGLWMFMERKPSQTSDVPAPPSNNESKPPPVVAVPPDQKALQELQKFELENAGDPARVLKQYRDIRPSIQDREITAKIDERIKQLEDLVTARQYDVALGQGLGEIVGLDLMEELPKIVELLKKLEEGAGKSERTQRQFAQIKQRMGTRVHKSLEAELARLQGLADKFVRERQYQGAVQQLDAALIRATAAAYFPGGPDSGAAIAARKKEVAQLLESLAAGGRRPRGYADVKVRYYEGDWEKMPDLAALAPKKQGPVDKGVPRADLSDRPEFYALAFEGKLVVATPGFYTLSLQSDDGSQLFVDGKLVVDHDGMHDAIVSKNGDVELTAGAHGFRLLYFQKNGGRELIVSWQGPDFGYEPIPAAAP